VEIVYSLEISMGLFDKLKSRIADAVMVTIMTKFIQKYEAGELVVSRRAGRVEDAVTPERQSAITYEFRTTTPMRGIDLKSFIYNPDRGTELEPDDKALEPGVVTDPVVAMAVLTSLRQEVQRSLRGEDPDVVVSPESISLKKNGNVGMKTIWKARR